MNQNIEHLEAQLQGLCDTVTGHCPPKDKAPYILYIGFRPIPNGPVLTYVCNWMEMILGDENVIFRAGHMSGTISFTAKMVKDINKTKSVGGTPGMEINLASTESWQNA